MNLYIKENKLLKDEITNKLRITIDKLDELIEEKDEEIIELKNQIVKLVVKMNH